MCHRGSATRPTLFEKRHVTGLNLHVAEVFKRALTNSMWFLKYFGHKSKSALRAVFREYRRSVV